MAHTSTRAGILESGKYGDVVGNVTGQVPLKVVFAAAGIEVHDGVEIPPAKVGLPGPGRALPMGCVGLLCMHACMHVYMWAS